MTCAKCGQENPSGARFCMACGINLVPRGRFGSPESYTPPHLAEKILTARNALEGERKQVTVLFCDLVGSTTLAGRVGPEAMHALLDRFFDLALGEVHRFEGTINQFLGDGFMALFGAPVAHEDHARRAVLAAFGIQRALRERALPNGVALEVRMGLNTGPVVVGKIGDNLRMDYTAVGDTTNLAARLQQLASVSDVLVSEATHRLVEGFARTSFVGEHAIKGKAEPQRVYRVEGVSPDAARFDVARREGLTPFVGREREMEVLDRCWAEARTGALRVVHIVGEAGIGKSRVVHEFRERVEASRLLFLQGHCVSYGRSTPFLPFVEIVRAAFRVAADDGPETITAKLARGLDLLGLKPDERLPLLLSVLGLPADDDALRGLDEEIIGVRTREMLQELLRERCRLSPSVVFVDDLHWIDSASEELIARVVRHEPTLSLLVVGACRPEYRPPWAGGPGVQQMRLAPLTDEGCRHLVHHRVGGAPASPDIVDFVVGRAEGNPLFAEEIVRYLLESGRLQGPAASGPPEAVREVPGRLSDLIMARIDRLPDGHRALLQLAAVVGRRVPVDVLATAAGRDDAGAVLREIEKHELVFREDPEGREVFCFKHALIQDALYDSLLTPQRVRFHERVGDAIEQLHADRLGEWADVLAHHYSQTPRADRAVRYIALTGEKSLKVYAVDEAHQRFREVVERVDSTPGCAEESFVADVLVAWARAFYYRRDFRGFAGLERYLPRVEALGDPRRLSLFLFWLGFCQFNTWVGSGRTFLEKALALGESIGDEECIGYACMGLAWLYSYCPGDRPPEIAERMGQRGRAIGAARKDIYLESKCLVALVAYTLLGGRYRKAAELIAELRELSRAARDPRTMAMALLARAFLAIYDGERYDAAIAHAEEALRISPDPLDILNSRTLNALSLALMRPGPDNLAAFRGVREECQASGNVWMCASTQLPYGAARVLAGQMRSGVREIQTAIAAYASWGNRATVAFGNLLLGEIYLHMVLGDVPLPLGAIVRNLWFILRARPGAARRARRQFDEAIRLARDVDAPAVVARGLLNLGLLARAQGHNEDSRRLLEDALASAESQSPGLVGRIQEALRTAGA